jgi:hypothetical protein
MVPKVDLGALGTFSGLGLRALLHSIVQSIRNKDGIEIWRRKGKVKIKQDINRNIIGIY